MSGKRQPPTPNDPGGPRVPSPISPKRQAARPVKPRRRAAALYRTPAMFRAEPFRFLLYVLLIPLAGLGVVLLLLWYVNSVSKRLTIRGNDLVYEWGVFSRGYTEVKIDRIRVVRVEQSFLQRIFHTGQIAVYTTGNDPEMVVHGIPDPNDFREMIRNAEGALKRQP